MTRLSCGDRLQWGKFAPGSAGCLVRFAEHPHQVFLLTAGHVVLPPFAQRGDAITEADSTNIIGRLYSWTNIDGDPTADSALIWVDPQSVSPEVIGLGVPTGVNLQPAVDDVVRLVAYPGQKAPRQTTIRHVDADVEMLVIGPGWEVTPTITYRSQIVTEQLITEGGDSGAIAMDANGRVIGMVVGGNPTYGTVITPIAAILRNAAWGGLQLELVGSIDRADQGPPVPGIPVSAVLPPQSDINKTEMQIAFGQKVSAQFKSKLIGIAKELEVEPNYLMAAMAFETGGTFDPSIRNAAGSGATGLIQFMPNTAIGLRTTTDALAQMTAEEQLDYVKKYFLPRKGKLQTLEDVYMAILFPKAIGQSDGFVLFKKPAHAYTQNAGLDMTKDGEITKGEASARVRQKLNEGLKSSNIG